MACAYCYVPRRKGYANPITVFTNIDRIIAHLGRHLARLGPKTDARGNCDVSPRGDAPGFTHVLGPSALALPDRPGNRRGDSFHNILDNPHAGLLYLIPGGKQVLRINGRARILTDAPFFDAMARDGRRPDLALVLDIDEIYLHCPQSLNRSGLWKSPAARTS
ncbi:Pyridoxamine 5'-phosphate oxidase putative domain-containing protein OS=Streptomyces fumanus OX=67302 GN=GCM10018772_18600 PE=4 SV=1 [Streptomyces fumanus]